MYDLITLSLPRSGACNLAIRNCARVRPAAVALCLRSRNAILQSVLLVQFARPGKHLISYAVVFVSAFHCLLVLSELKPGFLQIVFSRIRSRVHDRVAKVAKSGQKRGSCGT